MGQWEASAHVFILNEKWKVDRAYVVKGHEREDKELMGGGIVRDSVKN